MAIPSDAAQRSRVFDITAGEEATYYLVCNYDGSSVIGLSDIYSPRLTAIFTPAP